MKSLFDKMATLLSVKKSPPFISFLSSFQWNPQSLHTYSTLKLQPWVVKLLTTIGALWTLSFLAKNFKKVLIFILCFMKSWGNQRRIMRSAPSVQLHYFHKYVAIYGATTQVGQAFAKYFAAKGFNLILIDEYEDRLQYIESELRARKPILRKNSDSSSSNPQSGNSYHTLRDKAQGGSPIVRRIAISFSDGESTERKLEQKLRGVIDNHDFVKFFIDCKNLKIKQGAEYDLYDFRNIAKIVNFNARGSAILLRIMLKNMQFFKNGAIISVLNSHEGESHMKEKQSLYYASMLFKASMIDSVRRTSGEDVKFLMVYNGNKTLDDAQDKERVVRKTLEYVGVRDRIEV